MKFKAVLFDLIGTTVKEKDPAFINLCFQKAFGQSGITITLDHVKAERGKDKKEIITNILTVLKLPPGQSGKILTDYTIILDNSLDNFTEIDYLQDTLKYLKNKEIKTGLGTGLSRASLKNIMGHLSWDDKKFDYIATSEDVGSGRPNPAMILDMMNKLNIKPDELLKVGDTVSDILEGKNAGVKTAVILSGTQSEEELRSRKPDFVIGSLTELKEIVN